MALVKGIRRISPLNLNKNVTIGVAFPLDETNMFSGTQTIEDQAKANLINLLLTKKGDRVNLPNFGVGLQFLLFEPDIDIETLRELINDQILRYVPNITLSDVSTGLSDDGHTLYVQITYRSLLDGTQDTIQLNLNNK
tara:strand:+ start:4288 stop:4701 length:414 start_codon:yes stop_codon:yes gene_type:complete